MKYRKLHPWDLSPTEAVRAQKVLREKVCIQPLRKKVRRIAGADLAVFRNRQTAYAGVVVMSYPDLSVLETCWEQVDVSFPYIPGLLSFREVPVLIRVFESLKNEPDLILIDGQGIAHPRRMGLATHLGLVFDKPTVGCAKSRLYGNYQEPAPIAGSIQPLMDGQGEVIGAVVRTKTNVRPLFVSVGHKIDLKGSLHFVLSSCRGYRLPEPTRQAHMLVNRLKFNEASP